MAVGPGQRYTDLDGLNPTFPYQLHALTPMQYYTWSETSAREWIYHPQYEYPLPHKSTPMESAALEAFSSRFLQIASYLTQHQG